MTTVARSLLRDSDEAADVVEDVLVRIHDAAAGFRGERGLRTWVLRITANRCRDHLRRRRFRGGRPEDIDPLAAAGLHADPVAGWDERIDRPRMLAALERAIAQLPEEQQRAVVLRDRLGLSYEEAAATLGIPLGALKSRLFRARETLKRTMKEWFREA
jgi:RNA polymerase sigma-70 factor (ECF subfamily)